MAHSEYYYGLDRETAIAVAEEWAQDELYPKLTIDDEGTIKIYGGNRRERAACCEFIQKRTSKPAPVCAAEREPAPVYATERQVRYLQFLIAEDFGMASNFGLQNVDVKKLTKSEASTAIDQMLRG